MARDDEFNNFINELIDRNDILEVVRGYVDLTRKGNSYWGRCPFHHEKTASFHVEERLKIYKCFGCGAAGNVIKFIQEIESVSFMEAVKILADRVGMKVPEFHKNKSGEDLEEKKERAELHQKLVTAAARYYNMELNRNAKMLAYLESIGIDKSVITKFGLGYSAGPYFVTNYLMSLDYSEQEIDDAGVGYGTDDDRFKDWMSGRIIVPHINTFGKVTGFAGCTKDGDTRYTKNTDIFRRDSEVFGTHVLKTIKKKENIDSLIVTNTPFDAVMLYAHGRKKVVSSMGDEVTSRQARALMRYTDKFTVLFSGVEEGKDKNFKGLDPLLDEGASVKVATLTEKFTVPSFVEKRSLDRLLDRIDGAKSLLEYQLGLLAKDYDLKTAEGKEAYLLSAKDYVMTIKERSKQEPYISVLSKIAKVREDSIRVMFYEDKVAKSDETIKRVTKKRGKAYNAMITLLAFVRAGVELGEDITDMLEGEYRDYYTKVRAGEMVETAGYFTDSEVAKMDDIAECDGSSQKLIRDCLKILHDESVKKRRDDIIKLIDEETDLDKKRALIERLNDLMREQNGNRNR